MTLEASNSLTFRGNMIMQASLLTQSNVAHHEDHPRTKYDLSLVFDYLAKVTQDLAREPKLQIQGASWRNREEYTLELGPVYVLEVILNRPIDCEDIELEFHVATDAYVRAIMIRHGEKVIAPSTLNLAKDLVFLFVEPRNKESSEVILEQLLLGLGKAIEMLNIDERTLDELYTSFKRKINLKKEQI